MRRRGITQIFSTSSIDMLACGLGAVLVLWLLVFGNTGGALDGEKTLGSGEMRIRQFGISHLQSFRVPDAFLLKSVTITDEVGTSSLMGTSELAKFEGSDARFSSINYCSNRKSFAASYTRVGGSGIIEVTCQASTAFAKEVAIRFEAMSAAIEVDLTIDGCRDHLEVHYLSIEAIDRRGVTPERYVFHCENEAKTALATSLTESLATAPSSSIDPRWTDARRKTDLAWLFNFRNAIRDEIGLMCENDRWSPALNYRVYDCGSKREIGFGVRFSGDGAVRWVEPPTSEPPSSVGEINGRSIEEHFVSWVGAPFGAKRTMNGLGVCTP